MRKLWIVFLFLLLFRVPAVHADITLTLFDPEYSDCGRVTINGVVMGDGGIFDLIWDWGDGTKVSSFFPASHRYEANGTYTVLVTAIGCSTKRESTTVQVSNAEDPGCPPVSGPECYYLFPYNLHLTVGTVSAAPLEVRDQSGNAVAGSITFSISDTTMISVSTDGYVTALREEGPFEIGSWIQAMIDGHPVANTCIVRVLSEDYGTPFYEIVTENTALYYPTDVNGENLETLITQYQIPTVNEYAYKIQAELMGTEPFEGCRQIFEVDFGESEQQRVCGISGNPIRLGWNILGNEWQNCFLVPFFPPRSPQWFVFYHELGHNFTWASTIFVHGLGTFVYSEGLASAMSLAVMENILADLIKFPLENSARNSLQSVHENTSNQYLQALQQWLGNGADFSLLNPDIADGIWLTYANDTGSDFAVKFFLPLQPKNITKLGGVLCDVGAGGEDAKHTFFAALVSAAAGRDLSDVFINTYHYPLNQTLFDAAYAAFRGIIAEWGCPGNFDYDGDVDGSDLAVFAADFGRTDCASGQDCEGDFDEDNDVDGSDLATFAADFGRTDCP